MVICPDSPWLDSLLRPKKPSISDAPELDDDYQRGFLAGLEARESGRNIDFAGIQSV
ncbi:hypothetical protein [Streptococcus dysgalactiae]|uniref:hypothetical protein n=1 Tax=Streptococcus dysgalactiae TaxID=1334 RepID=UPI00195018D7|nr:hypothetical protein [Streptococcus dysgalactiae]MBM6547960.1 hypothetical protein [Streptococcus dysgalactiae subsp. equisimilis]VTY17030.1 Uncharacterised protein [Streptococcus dysgalactiae]